MVNVLRIAMSLLAALGFAVSGEASEVTDLTAKLGLGLADGEELWWYSVGLFAVQRVDEATFFATMGGEQAQLTVKYTLTEPEPCRVLLEFASESKRRGASVEGDKVTFVYDLTKLMSIDVREVDTKLIGKPETLNSVAMTFKPDLVVPDSVQRVAAQINGTSISVADYEAAAHRLLELCPPGGVPAP